MSVTVTLAHTDSPCRVEGLADDKVASAIWFKTSPLDRTFCHRATQLQLCSDSDDLAHVDGNAGSWFEVAIFSHAAATEPRTKDGRELAWHSHKNTVGSATRSRHFGVIFDRRQDLLDDLEPGNVLAVRVCARYPGAVNNAIEGHLTAKLVTEDLFSHNSWTLSPLEADMPTSIGNGVYTLTSTSGCVVKANDNPNPNLLSSQIWFSTPALDGSVVAKIEEIQLHTNSHDQGPIDHPEAGSWSGFDIVILESHGALAPRVKDGRSLVWLSHSNKLEKATNTQQGGRVFNRHDDLLNSLEVGNVIAVRVCAQFPDWENHAQDGHLVVRISNTGQVPHAVGPTVNWAAIAKRSETLRTLVDTSLNSAMPSGTPHASSLVAQLVSEPMRADEDSGAGKRPLRLLSLDGGGVRGISSLEILREIMAQVSSDPNARPCDYFDMMAGTSTGGLIAVMLGRLKMTVPECIKAYNKFGEDIFAINLWEGLAALHAGARYSGDALAKAVKGVVKDHDKDGNENAVMLDEADGCKVFVVACRADNLDNQAVKHMRTYVNHKVSDSFASVPIWQACRATSAAPTYFPRMKIGNWEYVDGGLRCNNPILLLLLEAGHYFGPARPIGCVVTLGTGMAPNIDLGPESNIAANALGVLNAMRALATSGETANQEAAQFVAQFVAKDAYYRFNVGEKIAGDRVTAENWADVVIALDDYKNMGKFVALTDKYLDGETARIAQCAAKLAKSS